MDYLYITFPERLNFVIFEIKFGPVEIGTFLVCFYGINFGFYKVSDVPIRNARGSRSSAEIYDEREYFRLENSAASCGSLVALEYSARAQPSGRSIKNGSQVEWNLLFFTLIQWSTWRLIQTKQKYL